MNQVPRPAMPRPHQGGLRRNQLRSRSQWTLGLGARQVTGQHSRLGWSRYERFSFLIVLLLSSVMLAVTAGLHFYNYNRETRSSSTSGSHSDFSTSGAKAKDE